jgi:hypothetical protein
MDFYSCYIIPTFRRPSVVDSVNSGTCVPSCCLAEVVCIIILTHNFKKFFSKVIVELRQFLITAF